MTTRAFLVAGGAAPDRGPIGGLSAMVRQALSLQDAGISELFVVGLSAAELWSAVRVRARVLEIGAADAAADRAAIVARAGAIWHPAVASRLVKAAPAPQVALGAGGIDLLVCGHLRVAEAVAALAEGRSIEPQATIALEPREFIVLPRSDSERRAATRLLLRSLDKPSDGLASRYLHRPISRQVTRLLLPWPVTPNAMTLAAAVFGVVGAVVACRGGYWRVLAGAALFEVQNILDGCDGEIARLKYLRSRGGEWLDQVIDDVLNIAFLIAIGVALARGGASYAWPVTVAAAIAQLLHVVGLYAGLLLKAGGRGSVARLRWWVGSGGGGSVLADLTRRDILSTAYVAAALFDVVPVIFVWHAALTIGAAVVTTLQWIVWGGPGVQTDGDGVPDPASGATA